MYQTAQKHYLGMVDNALEAYLSAGDMPDTLRESMRYSVFAGGKRLRPVLTLAACEMLQGDVNRAMPFACALEMIHAYSLIHDDLPAMDNDTLRRGKPTNHVVYGEGQAILAGDGLLSYAFEIMLHACTVENDKRFLKAALAVAHGAGVFGMVAGQCLDLKNEGKEQVTKETLYAIHKGKTAAMIKAAIEAGAYCAGADAQQMDALRAFGEAYGLLFQITDDILDETGNAKSLGKSIGKDKQAGKITFVTIFGLEGAKEYARQTAHDACKALTMFGQDAWYFQELINKTLVREK
ncbi:polyprenyl synthetase family protein [Christensenellaceae bacterium OttesenSCG-928-L17]|nr:polyprenyl synthetase family protein [Christensenellaceae bacterium OttesenSCG-928-L17]